MPAITAPLTGLAQDVKFAATKVQHNSNWKINTSASLGSYIDNTTLGLEAATRGKMIVNGSFTCSPDQNNPIPVMPNDEGSLQLYIDATHYWMIGTVLIESCPEECDSNGNVISVTVNWKYAGGTVTGPDGRTYNSTGWLPAVAV